MRKSGSREKALIAAAATERERRQLLSLFISPLFLPNMNNPIPGFKVKIKLLNEAGNPRQLSNIKNVNS
jgi:hypothetical protein